MKKILITGANSYVGTHIEKWLKKEPKNFSVNTVDTLGDKWKDVDFSQFDVVFDVAGIAHVDPKPKMAPLYYKVNRDLTVEIAKWAKSHGVKQFIFMSSRIVYHASKSLKGDITLPSTIPNPNDFYGDSKLQAETGLNALISDTFKIANIRPPMIYGPNCKGNFLRLGWLATKVPVFPAWHNKRSMLYIDNLAEFVKQIILRELDGTFYPQNREYSDTVEIVRFFAHKYNHNIWISRLFNPLVWFSSFILPAIPKMFANSYYDSCMSKYDFDYQLVSLYESLKFLEITEENKYMKPKN